MKKRIWMVPVMLLLLLPAYSASGVNAPPQKGAPPLTASREEAPMSVEERRLRASLRDDTERLRKREEDVRLREMELKTLESQVDKKLAELKKIREEINATLARRTEAQVGRVRELGQMYEKMEPAKAALLLAGLDEKLAVEILSVMKKKAAGRVLGNMEQAKAARLSEAYQLMGPR